MTKLELHKEAWPGKHEPIRENKKRRAFNLPAKLQVELSHVTHILPGCQVTPRWRPSFLDLDKYFIGFEGSLEAEIFVNTVSLFELFVGEKIKSAILE